MSEDMNTNSEAEQHERMMSELHSNYSAWHLEAARQERRKYRIRIVKVVLLGVGATIGLIGIVVGIVALVTVGLPWAGPL